MRSGIAPKNRLINPRRRPVIPARGGLAPRPLLQIAPLFALLAQQALIQSPGFLSVATVPVTVR